MTRARTKVPKSAQKGEVVKVKALISHPMESGHRRDQNGKAVPRNILRGFECHFNDQLVFVCDLYPSVSANPYFEFYARVEQSGLFHFRWYGPNGVLIEAMESIDVI